MTDSTGKKTRVAIIGKTPPPLGGVTIHVDRLLYHARKIIPVDFIPIRISNLIKLPLYALRYQIFHLHASNAYLQAIVSLFCALIHRPLILTIHRDFGALQSIAARLAERIAVRYASKTIVLNEASYEAASLVSNKCEIISSFIPPIMDREIEFTSEETTQIENLKAKNKMTFCTNAFKRCEDTQGRELYGIEESIDVFRKLDDYGLIVLDPSGTYREYFSRQKVHLPDNILLLSGEHSFIRLIGQCDGTIRNTSTDGDSLSVKESLYLGKLTLATDVVNRPQGAIVYQRGELYNCLTKIINGKCRGTDNNRVSDGSRRIIEIYLNYLSGTSPQE